MRPAGGIAGDAERFFDGVRRQVIERRAADGMPVPAAWLARITLPVPPIAEVAPPAD